MGSGSWIKSNEGMDWWSAQDFCASLGKELITPNTVGANAECNSNPTARQLYNEFSMFGGQWGLSIWLNASNGCNINYVRSLGSNILNPEVMGRNDNALAICQPIGYTEPDPICPTGTYNISSNTCE